MKLHDESDTLNNGGEGLTNLQVLHNHTNF